MWTSLLVAETPGLSTIPVEQLAFADHSLQVGQDAAFLFTDDKDRPVVYYGRVWRIRGPASPGGKRLMDYRNPVDLQDRPKGVMVECSWYRELSKRDIPLDLARAGSSCFQMGPAGTESCTCSIPALFLL